MHTVTDRQGNVVSDFNNIAEVAEDFYSELYSSNSSHPTISVINADQDRGVSCVTADEVKKIIKGISRGKAPGETGITTDFIKHGGDLLSKKLATLYRQYLKNSNVPYSCESANILLLHEGEVEGLKNYKTISQPSALYKTFTKVISNTIRATLEFNKPTEQARFRKGYSRIDHLHVINQVIEKSAEYNKPLYMAFVDYKKAFDSAEIPPLLATLRR